MVKILTSLESLHACLDANPGDLETRGVLADHLEDDGDHAGADFQRWLITEGKWPVVGACLWNWFPNDDPGRFNCAVSPRVFSLLVGSAMYNTRREAEEDLRRVMERIWQSPTTS